MNRFQKTAIFCTLTLASISGCTEALEETEMVPIEQVPETVMQVAQENLPDVKFETAWIEKEGNETYYEVRGKSADGKTRDIKVSPEGKVAEVD